MNSSRTHNFTPKKISLEKILIFSSFIFIIFVFCFSLLIMIHLGDESTVQLLSKYTSFKQESFKAIAYKEKALLSSVSLSIFSKRTSNNNNKGVFSSDHNIIQNGDVVFGMAQDTDPRYLAVFCKSFRQVNQIAQVYIFINTPINLKSLEIAQNNNITLLPYNITDLKYPKYHPSTTRWILYQSLFEQLMRQNNQPINRLESSSLQQYQPINHCLFIDVRDSYFQRDPFTTLPPTNTTHTSSTSSSGTKYTQQQSSTPFFYAYVGVEPKPIFECNWNSGWIRDCFGEHILNSIGNKQILCSGVSIADGETAYMYVKTMVGIITGNLSYSSTTSAIASVSSEISKASKFPMCERNGVDQVCNVLEYNMYAYTSIYYCTTLHCTINLCDKHIMYTYIHIQGVYNVLIHSNALPIPATLFTHDTGLVTNMQAQRYHITNTLPATPTTPTTTTSVTALSKLERERLMKLNPSQIVTNMVHEPVAIVHQYDRNKAYQKRLFKMVGIYLCVYVCSYVSTLFYYVIYVLHGSHAIVCTTYAYACICL